MNSTDNYTTNLYLAYKRLSPSQRKLFEALAGDESIDLSNACILPGERKRGARYPLSSTQARVFVFEALHGPSAIYNIASVVRMKGKTDLDLFNKALICSVNRHEIFRTGFEVLGGSPVQFIDDNALWSADRSSLRRVMEEDTGTALQSLIDAEIAKPFDLKKPPLLRVLIAQTGKDEHYVIFTMHHIVGDGWSVRIIVRETQRIYQDLLQGKTIDCTPAPVQYIDYALWERKRTSAGKKRDDDVNYWRSQLGAVLPRLHLPVNFERPRQRRYRGGIYNYIFSDQILISLKALCRDIGVSRFMLLFTAYVIFVVMKTQQLNVPVAVPTSGRNRVELENMIGYFGNTIILYMRVKPDRTVRDLLAEVRQTAVDAYAHQDVPFDELVREFNLSRNVNDGLMYDVMFEYMEFRQDTGSAVLSAEAEEGMPVSKPFDLSVDTRTAKCDYFLCVWEENRRLCCAAEYDTDLFSINTIQEWVHEYNQLLENMSENLDSSISDILQNKGKILNDNNGLSNLDEEFTF